MIRKLEDGCAFVLFCALGALVVLLIVGIAGGGGMHP